MSEGTKEFFKSAWNKISLGMLKAFRGLICEKKEGGWELSRSRVAFWVVFSHCMYVWNSGAKAAKAVANTAIDAAAATADSGVDIAAAAASEAVGALDSMADTVGTLSMQTGVSEQEFYLLLVLVGYSALKNTRGSITNALGALRGNK